MFDATGMLEIFVCRIDSREGNPRYIPPSPEVDEEGNTYLPETPCQERFAVCVFLTEKFACMEADTIKLTFSLDSTSSNVVRFLRNWQCPCMSATSGEDDRQTTSRRKKLVKHGSFEGLERVAFQDALLRPTNLQGWPLEPHELDRGSIIISLQRGRKQLCHDQSASKYHFVPLTGSAGATTTISFDYRSRNKGSVELLSTTTFSSSRAPDLNLTRTPYGTSALGKHGLEDMETVSESASETERPPSKRARLMTRDNNDTSAEPLPGLRTFLSPSWSEDL